MGKLPNTGEAREDPSEVNMLLMEAGESRRDSQNHKNGFERPTRRREQLSYLN